MSLTTHLRILLRRFAAQPGFTAISLLTLAIGIGANVAILTVVNAVLLRPLPFPESERLVILNHVAPGIASLDELPMSDSLYHFYSRESRSFESVAILTDTQVNFTGAEDPQRIVASTVTASFFDVTQTRPLLGRPFGTDDERPGAAPVAILSNSLWQARFAGDPEIVGRRIEIDRAATEIVGVMPPGFAFPRADTQLWQPYTLNEEEAQLGNFNSFGVARLAAGVRPEQARLEMTGMLSNLQEVFPDQPASRPLANAGFRPIFDNAREFLVGDIRAALWILLGAVGFLLLIACANVANLFLARAEGRHREIAIRFALGENRPQLMGSMLLEGLLLGLAGGLLALPLGFAAVRLLVRFGPQDLPRLAEVSPDPAVVAVSMLIAAFAGVLLGLLPALRVGALATTHSLMEGTRGAGTGRHRHMVRRALVVSQIALALMLLVGSGLALRSFQRLAALDVGFDPEETLTFRLELPERDYPDPMRVLTFHRSLLERLAGLPGVSAVAMADFVPLSGTANGSGYSFEDQPRPDDVPPPLLRNKQVSPGYFEAMGIEVLEGRSLEILDEEGGARVVVVSRSVAREHWPDRSALGRGLNSGGRPPEGLDWYRIVGVVNDVHELDLHDGPTKMVYYPLTRPTQDGVLVPRAATLIIRAASAASVTGPAREAVRSSDPNLPISDVQTLDTLLRRARGESAFVMLMLLVAAGFALLLGAIGLYGVISYVVSQRRREIAIRMAIGARQGEIQRMVLVEAGWLALLGTTLGVAASLILTRRLQALLYETSPLDPVVFVTVSGLLVAVCLFASWLPARRAATVEPVTALRDE